MDDAEEGGGGGSGERFDLRRKEKDGRRHDASWSARLRATDMKGAISQTLCVRACVHVCYI